MKALFIKRIDGKLAKPIHPFLGWRVNNFDEFISVVKEYFEKEEGYPGLVFSTKQKNIVVLFSGHQYVHGEEGKWAIFNTETDKYPTKWFNIKKDFDMFFELFNDAETVQAWADTMTKIVNAQGGITIKV